MGVEDLESYPIIKLDAELLRRQLKRVTEDRRGRSGSGRAASADASRRAVATMLRKAVQEAENTLCAIERRVDELEHPVEREVLQRHYLNGQSVASIAMDMYFDEQWIWKNNIRGRKHYHKEDPKEWILRKSVSC